MSELFNEWAVLELLGHRRLAGRVSETVIAGAGFVRIDVPEEAAFTTQTYGPGAVYCITPTSEDMARKLAASLQPEPVHQFELEPALPGDSDEELVF